MEDLPSFFFSLNNALLLSYLVRTLSQSTVLSLCVLLSKPTPNALKVALSLLFRALVCVPPACCPVSNVLSFLGRRLNVPHLCASVLFRLSISFFLSVFLSPLSTCLNTKKGSNVRGRQRSKKDQKIKLFFLKSLADLKSINPNFAKHDLFNLKEGAECGRFWWFPFLC